MHKKLHYLVVAGLIAITASGSLQLNAVVKNQEVTAVWEDAGDAANGADPQDDASADDAVDGTGDTDNPDGEDTTGDTDNPSGTDGTDADGTDADTGTTTGEIKAVWENSDTYNDANGTTDNNGGPTITASKTKFLINKGDNFDLLSSLGLKVVDATDGDITSTVPKVDIPTTSTGSINKVLKVTNKKGITSELPIQINIIDVPKSITVKSESELENYSWGNEIGASNALTINVSDLADGKVTLTVSDKVNTLDYQVAVNVKGSDSNDTNNDNNDNDANNDNANDTDTDVDNDTDADTDTDNDNDANNDNANDSDSDSTNDANKDNATGDNSNTDNPSGTTDNNGSDNASTGGGTGDDNQTVVNEDGSGDVTGDGTTSLDNTKTGAVAVGQIGVGLTGLLAMAIKRFRK